MNYLLGLDLGTSSVKLILISENGKVIDTATEEYPLLQPRNGWAEQDPELWWKSVVRCAQRIMERNESAERDIVAIGLTGQMHGLVLLDKDDQVIRPAIIWADQRSDQECVEITDIIGADNLLRISANPASTGFSASKLLWVKNNEYHHFSKINKVLLPKDYIRFKLTGSFATDVSDASGTQLFNVALRDWSPEIIGALGFNQDWFPRCFESPQITSYISTEASEMCLLKEGIPVVAGAGDNAASAVGTGVTKDGDAFLTIGTSGVLFAHTSEMRQDPQGRIHTFCSAVPDEWHVMGVTQAAGLSLRWFRDEFAVSLARKAENEGKSSYYYLDQAARQISIGSEGLIFLPYLMGERTPHLDPACRGVFFGLSARHRIGHLYRSIMEGVAFSLKDCMKIVNSTGIHFDSLILTGGGQIDPWNRILCDALGCTMNILETSQGASMGAALLAGTGCGLFSDIHDGASRVHSIKQSLTPISGNTYQYEQYYKIYRDLYPSLKDQFQALHGLRSEDN